MSKNNSNNDKPSKSQDNLLRSRRNILGAGIALTAGSIVPGMAAAKGVEAPPFEIQAFPLSFPRPDFVPDFSLDGKFAVITGASRGIGRATAEALVAHGVTVIGTSRDSFNVPNPPSSFDLLDLDITSDASVDDFVAALLAHPDYPGQIDILINNAGRYVVGTITPPPIAPDPAGFFQEAAQLGTETLYLGHVRVTNKLLPFMSQVGRLMFTVSSNAYWVGGGPAEAVFGDGFLSFQNIYTSGKRALLAYANNLRGLLRASGSPVKVSTVNPYSINTDLASGLNPVYTEPVDGNGNSPFNPVLQAFLDGIRASLQTALPASYVADAYTQLLSMSNPPPNVAVASTIDAATEGTVAFFNSVLVAENEEAAVRLGAGPPRRT